MQPIIQRVRYILAIDLGTSGPKVALVSTQGEVVDWEFEAMQLFLLPNGGAEQSPGDWWEAIKRAAQRLLARRLVPVDKIVALSCTTQWSGTVPVDRHGHPLMNAIIWMDSRGAPYARRIADGLVKVQGYGIGRLLTWLWLTGGAPTHSGKDSIAHILYIKNELPEIYRATYKFLEPMDYLNLRLTGQFAAAYNTVTLHWLTNNRDISNVVYDERLLKMSTIDRDKLPDLRSANDLLGPIKPEVAKELGLHEEVQVVMGTPDVHSAAIGSGAVRDYEGHLYIGTSSWLTCHVPFKKTDLFHNMASLPSAIPGKYLLTNEQECAGVCLDFLRDNILFHDDELATGTAPSAAYDIFNQIAERVPAGSGKVIFTPWLYGERTPVDDHLVRGGFFNQSLKTTREHLVRAVFEGVAYNSRWLLTYQEGFVSGAVYHGADEHIEFLNRVYAIHSQSNPLHSDVWPSTTKFEAEIVAMTARMLGAGKANEICGTVTSGGTESILLAMKTYRDWARDRKGITKPEMLIPSTAHPAFDKAGQYFNIKVIRVPAGADYKADVAATCKAITRNTIVVVGSAPSFPHGVIDPIAELSELARQKGIGFHTDACLGGFLLPWAEKLGYCVPSFDFRLPGVTSMSADTHKYGYAAKGTSVVLYRGSELRRYQYFTATDWPGGMYFSPTFAGSRPGGLSAVCWAAMLAMGEQGYLEATQRILETAAVIRRGIEAIPELRVLGDPLWVIAFTSDQLDIYEIMEAMSRQKWNLNGLHKPPAAHICVTLRHTQPGVAERFLDDLASAVEDVRMNPGAKGGMAPVYGLAATLPFRGVVGDMLKRYIDLLYKV